jgi:hypothetical protein
VALVVRHQLSAAIVAAAVAATAGFFVFARPQYRPHHGTSITIPKKHAAADAAGRAGWTWPDGVPGWEPGEEIKGFNVSQIQQVEAQPAALAAAHTGLDASQVRVIDAEHVLPGGSPLAVFAAPVAESPLTTTCLAVGLPVARRIEWRCPGASVPYPDVATSRVLAGVVVSAWPAKHGDARRMFALVGVARGDVKRVILHLEGDPDMPADRTLYERGTTWGQFESNLLLGGRHDELTLRVFGDRGLVQTIPLQPDVPGERIVG